LLPPDQQTPAVSAYRPTSTAAPMAASLPPAQQQTPAASAYWATSTTAPMAASLPPAPQQTPAVSAYRPMPTAARKSASLEVASATSATSNTAQPWKAVAPQPVVQTTPPAPVGRAGLGTAPVETTAPLSPRTFTAPAQVLGIRSPLPGDPGPSRLAASEKTAATASSQPVTQSSAEPSSLTWENAPTKSA